MKPRPEMVGAFLLPCILGYLMDTDVAELSQKLEEHIDMCQQRFDEGDAEFLAVKKCIEENTEAVRRVEENTDEIISAWNNIKGATSVGIAVQKFGVWLVKWPLIGTGLYAIWKWFLDTLP